MAKASLRSVPPQRPTAAAPPLAPCQRRCPQQREGGRRGGQLTWASDGVEGVRRGHEPSRGDLLEARLLHNRYKRPTQPQPANHVRPTHDMSWIPKAVSHASLSRDPIGWRGCGVWVPGGKSGTGGAGKCRPRRPPAENARPPRTRHYYYHHYHYYSGRR